MNVHLDRAEPGFVGAVRGRMPDPYHPSRDPENEFRMTPLLGKSPMAKCHPDENRGGGKRLTNRIAQPTQSSPTRHQSHETIPPLPKGEGWSEGHQSINETIVSTAPCTEQAEHRWAQDPSPSLLATTRPEPSQVISRLS